MARHRRHHLPKPGSAPTTLEEHLSCFRQKFPNIRPFEEEADLNWWNDGLDALAAHQLQGAETIFKKLTLAQPEHFDGYFGLAQVYQRRGQLPAAIIFADEAVRLAEAMMPEGDLDPITLEELKTFRAQLEPAA